MQITKERSQQVKEKKANENAEKLAKLNADLEHWKNEYYRAYADMQNLRKQVEKDHREAIKYRAEGFIENLLPILDGFHMALEANVTSQEMKNFLVGFEFIYRNLVSVLENEGVSELAPKVGDQFDPSTMQAIETVYDESIKPNTITKVNVKGYKLHDRLIRPSIVVVSTNKKDEPKEEKEDSPEVDA